MVDLDSDGPGTSSGRRVRKWVTFWHQTFPGFLSQKIPKSYPNFLRVAGTLGNKYIAYTWFMFITAVGRNIQTKCRKKTARAGWNHTGSHRFSLSYEGLYSTLFSQRWKQKNVCDSMTQLPRILLVTGYVGTFWLRHIFIPDSYKQAICTDEVAYTV